MGSRFPEVDLTKVARTSIVGRKSKVRVSELASVVEAGSSFSQFLESLPNLLAGNSLREAVSSIAQASRSRRAVVACIGGHVIKTGQAPLLISLMRRGIVTAIAGNGSVAIHDLELALFGHTSEYVEDGIASGAFGMMKETADFMNKAAVEGSKLHLGLGESVGRALLAADCQHKDISILARAYEMRIPVTLHVALGTDIVHMHPSADGAAIGDCSLRDFRILVEAMRLLGGGGVLLNIGSAVVLPEVVLKAYTVLRNLGVSLEGMTSVSMDFLQHYRATQQVVSRVKEIGGRGIALTGHHEIMVPLLAAAVIEELEG